MKMSTNTEDKSKVDKQIVKGMPTMSKKTVLCAVTASVVTTLAISTFLVVGFSYHWFTHSAQMARSGTDRIEKIEVIIRGEMPVSEKIEYNSTANMAIFMSGDGSFTIQQFSQGLEIRKPTDSKSCFLTPADTTPEEGADFERYLNGIHGLQNITVEKEEEPVVYGIVDRPIEDTSFLPQIAVDACTEGFYWRVPVSSEDDSGDDSETSLSRKKRGLFRRIGRVVRRVGRAVGRAVRRTVRRVGRVVRRVVRRVGDAAKKVGKAILKLLENCEGGCALRYDVHCGCMRSLCGVGCTSQKK